MRIGRPASVKTGCAEGLFVMNTMAATGASYQPLLAEAQRRLFNAADTVCLERARLITEADRLHAAEPLPLRRALCLKHILANMSLDLDTNPLMAGNTSSAPRTWMLTPEFGLQVNGQIAIEHDSLPPDFLEGKVPADIVNYWSQRAIGNTPGGCAGIGHMSIDFDTVVNRGLQAVLDDLQRLEGSGSDEQQVYRRAMAVACQAVISWAERYAAEAERRAAGQSSGQLAECYQRIAEACRHVPRYPARNYFEGLQAMLLAHLATVVEGQGMSQSIGLPDRVLARFADEVAGGRELAIELTAAFVLGVAANSYQGRGSKTQAVTVGGAMADGSDAGNSITGAFLEAFKRTPVNDPHLYLRWHQRLDPGAMHTASRMLSQGRSMPLLVNDHQAAPALVDCGIAPADAWDYCICGCNEIGIPGRCTVSAFAMGAALVDVELLHTAVEQSPEAATPDELLAVYQAETEALMQVAVENSRQRLQHLAQVAPFPFTSACCRGSVEAGADYLLAMPYSRMATFFARGTTNAINALAAIDDIVCRRRLVESPGQLLKLVREDDQQAALWIRRAPKWGADDERADKWAVALHEARQRAIGNVEQKLGLPILVCHVIRSLHHLGGRNMKSTLDGRRDGESLAASIGAQQDTGPEVPTALLSSVLKLDARRYYRGIYNLNLTLPAGRMSAEILSSLCQTFFARGGQQLQVASLSADELKKARQTPDDYQHLVVRIAGLNARFVELSAMEQQEIIARAEAAEAS